MLTDVLQHLLPLLDQLHGDHQLHLAHPQAVELVLNQPSPQPPPGGPDFSNITPDSRGVPKSGVMYTIAQVILFFGLGICFLVLLFGIVTAVRTAVASADRALQLPSRLLDSVEQTLRTLLAHTADAADHGLLDADLGNVGRRIAELQRVTADFYDALGQLVQSDVTKDDVFDGNRDRVVEALRQFAREYDRALVRVDAA